MRLIHTADVHLDRCYAAERLAPGEANRRRQRLREAFREVARRAGEWPADALLIAGDLFELERVTRDTVAFLQAEFASIPHVLVCIAPGNHDPFTARSPYATETWPENVVIFSRPEWTAHEAPGRPLTIHGFGFDGPDPSANPFGALRIAEDGRIHAAVAHGSEMGRQPADKGVYAPFRAADAAAPGLAYLALGHLHAMTPVTGDFDTRIYYSGAPQGHHFGERGVHGYLEVELDGSDLSVAFRRACPAIFETYSVDCAGFRTSQQVIDAVRALARPEAAALLARVTLTGTAAPEWRGELDAVRDVLAPEFDYLELIDETEPAEDFDALAAQPTSLGEFVRRLNDDLRDTTDPGRRRLLLRARELGAAAYTGRPMSVPGLEGE